jgi:HK97 family phage major capsid protein
MASLVETIKRNEQATRAMSFGRYVQCLGLARGDSYKAIMHAQAHFGDSPHVIQALQNVVKTAVPAGTSTDATWGGPLVLPATVSSEFVALLRGLSVLGRLNTRPAPFNCKFSRATTGTSAAWVGEGKGAPVSKMDFDGLQLGVSKIVALAVLTDELMRNSTPAAAALVSADLAVTVATFLDASLLNPDLAGVPGESPASITFGAPQFVSSGNSFANVTNDLKLMMRSLATSPGVRLRDATWIMSETVAATWCTLTNTNSDFAFDELGPAGGFLFKLPVLTTGTLATPGSPTEEIVTLVDAQHIALADEGDVGVEVGRHPTLQMLTDPVSGATQQVSLWAQNLVGLKITRFCNFLLRRAGAVCVLRGINL